MRSTLRLRRHVRGYVSWVAGLRGRWGIGRNKGPFLGEARDWVRARARARGRAAVSRTDSRRELAAALVRRLGRHELRARVHHSPRARAQCARQPRGSPESPDASSNCRARVILAQRVAPEPCAQLQQTCANAARRFGQIDGETSARRMIGDGSSHAPTARSERGCPSERTSSRTRRRAHISLTRTMPPAVPRPHYLPAWSGCRPRQFFRAGHRRAERERRKREKKRRKKELSLIHI